MFDKTVPFCCLMFSVSSWISDGATNYGVDCSKIPPPSNHSIPRDPSHPKGRLKGVQGSEAGDNKCMIVDNINGLSKNKTMIYETSPYRA